MDRSCGNEIFRTVGFSDFLSDIVLAIWSLPDGACLYHDALFLSLENLYYETDRVNTCFKHKNASSRVDADNRHIRRVR